MNSDDLEWVDQEDEPHVDERWLISYADMMTLLFGLFVLLYSMYDRFDIVQDSVKTKFGTEKNAPAKDPGANVQIIGPDLKVNVDALKRERLDLQGKNLALQSENEKLKADLQRANDQLEIFRNKPDSDLAQQQIQDLMAQREQLLAQLARFQGVNPSNGRGAGGPLYRNFHVKVTLPDDSTFEENTIFLGPHGLMLSKPLPVEPQDHMSMEISNGTTSVQVEVRPVLNGRGQVTKKLKFLDFKNDDERVLDQWLGIP